jgi:hypothetical protein
MALNQFLVPQFIDVETKIIGPITTRQFLIMMVDGMLCFIFYKIFYFGTFVTVALFCTAIFGIVAFFKINGMPFHYFFLNLVQTLRRPRLRLWHREDIHSLPPTEKRQEVKKELIAKAPLTGSRLTSLSLVVNTGGAFKEES